MESMNDKPQEALEPWLQEALDFSRQQSLAMIQTIGVDNPRIPRSIRPDGSLNLEEPINAKGSLGWTTGFFPGSLWYLYAYLARYGTEAEAQEMLGMAKAFTAKLAPVQNLTNDHDVGFVMYCSYGTALQITGDASYKPILLQTAASLKTRFNPTVGLIKSWDWWGDRLRDHAVIMDNMMNLELLYWAARESGDASFKMVADSHASATLKNHFRADGSAFHMVVYDPATGAVKQRRNYQGYDDNSVWARGHAWALYGFTMAYRESRKPEYLANAVSLAHYLYSHPRMPPDLVPYWDFADPRIPNIQRDASAAAVYASALYELSQYASGADRQEFKKLADATLKNLASPAYRETKVGANSGFILKHSVGSLEKSLMFEIDVPLNYADYYFLEAISRKLKLEGKL